MPDFTPVAHILALLAGFEKELVGSVAINGTGADFDIAVRMPIGETVDPQGGNDLRDITEIIQLMRDNGCTLQGGAHYEAINLEADDRFTSLRFGDFNFLLCFNDRSWTRFTKGRDACILLRELGVDMSDKAVRVAVHALSNGMSINEVQRDLARLPRRINIG